MKDTSDDVALSEVIGFVLLLALVVAALSLYMVYIVPVNGREVEISQLNRINEQFTDYKFTLDDIRTSVQVNNVSPVMTSTSFNLGTGGGNTQTGGIFLYMLQPASSSATLSINNTGDTFDIDSSSYHNSEGDMGEFPINITALEYRSNNYYWIQQRYSYQLGGVFLSQDDGLTNRISPLISFTNSANNSIVVNIVPVKIVGGGSLSGNGPARVDTRMRILPKYNISTDPYLSNTWVNLSVTSADYETASMWLNIFNDTATREHLSLTAYNSGISPKGSPATTAYINITGTNADPNWKDVSLYVERAEYYVAFNNFITEPIPTPTPTPTPTGQPAPTFTSITPNSGPITGGTPVSIVGGNFVSGGSFGVTIGGAPATSVVWVDASHITAVTPSGTAGARDVVITNNDGQTATGTGAYTYVGPPTFTSITPNSGTSAGGTPVTIVGGNFISGGSFGVTIGGAPATSVVRVDASHITAVTPAGTVGARDVVITNNDGQTVTGTGAYTYFTIQIFTSSTSWSVPVGVNTVEYLVVAGGGGGGRYGGGGGAGGFRTGTLTGLSGSQTVTVGAGGSAGIASGTGQGGNGGNSVFASVTSAGGGGGGSYYTTTAVNHNGLNGGSGGGSVGTGSSVGLGNTPSVTPSQGNDGGLGITYTSGRYNGGGGGGAGSVGDPSTAQADGGDGGAGSYSDISGTSTPYAGGGGGGGRGAAGTGGVGGGGAGSTGTGTAGTANTGGGGGGGGRTGNGGAGGSGIVIIKYY